MPTRTTLAAVALLAVGTLLDCLTATAQPRGPAQPNPAAGIPSEITTPDQEETRLVASGKGKRLGEAIHRFPLLFLVAQRIRGRRPRINPSVPAGAHVHDEPRKETQ
jgi:hypothetical protein